MGWRERMGLGREGEKERGERTRMKRKRRTSQFGGTVATEPRRRLAELWTSAPELESGV